ncbi:site-specific integrase [Actinopolymorpha singaporensis]|uniref:Site-specific recombinase XerD n=1 Tax=Actinopolymorpha singaporensis TaxID=117157 RepID=A0A1H1TBT8_9ACTN|nr:site-specific integrase [Actinopolymorpha singaporensis]SDS57531.1 Site-specific recombinase XerD [Actinopolymorpha singaporensis]
MARPPLPVGTAGETRIYATSAGFRAMCKVRDYDGVVRIVERRGRSKEQARNRLREAVRDRVRADAGSEIRPDTRLSDLAELWFAEVSDMDRSPTTLELYRQQLDKRIIPALGNLRIREATVSRVDRFVKSVRLNPGPSTAKTVRTILSGMFGLAARHEALTHNPARDIARIETRPKASRALTLAEAQDLRAKVAASAQARRWDLVDFIDMMLATGLRIGETAAIVWDAVDLEVGTVEVRGTVVRLKGQGVVIKPKPKSRNGWRTLVLPSWAVEMLRRRQDGGVAPDEPVFPAPLGGVRDPSNTHGDLRRTFDEAGYMWVTSHVFRKTVATLMDHAGLSARAAADQLGHAKVSMTQDVYMGRKVASTGAAAVLERLVNPAEEAKSVG